MDATLLQDAAIRLAEAGHVPDAVIRVAIRRLCGQRLTEDVPQDPAVALARTEAFLAQMRAGPIAPIPQKANEQHYEVPAEFFTEALGPHLKYSCAYWSPQTTSLAEAEAEALSLTGEHAGLADGQRVLDLGCGWGSLTLWAAERYRNSRFTAVSNSASQRAFITATARARGLDNVEVLTADINALQLRGGFDRVVSVEMFEHMRNWPRLLGNIAGWLAPQGRLLVHIFCHRSVPYPYSTEGASNWMGRHFFSGGMMPSDDLLLRCRSELRITRQWRWPGTHYQRTADAWLANVDERRERVDQVLAQTYGPEQASAWRQRWRMFFMACAELFGYEDGRQWWVSHYLLER